MAKMDGVSFQQSYPCERVSTPHQLNRRSPLARSWMRNSIPLDASASNPRQESSILGFEESP